MKFSNTKNAVRAYFERKWNREDMMNPNEIPMHAHKSLKKVYITLFCAMLTATFGSFLHLISEVGGLFTVLSSVASLCCLVYTSPWKEKKRVFLLMIAAFSFGASVGIFTKYFFGINQDFVFSSLAGTTIGFGTFWVGAWSIRRRSVYINCWLVSIILLFLWFVIAADIFGGHTARWMPWISHYCLLVYE